MYYDNDGRLPKLNITRVNSDTIKFQISDKLSSIATYLMISATGDTIGAVICGVIPGAQPGTVVLGISAALKELASYLIDKFGGSRSVYMYAQVQYGINTLKMSYTFWIIWPVLKWSATITIKQLYIKKITTGWGFI